MKDYNYTVTLTSAKGHKIEIDPEQLYGYFDEPDGAEGGGLWFEHRAGHAPQMELTDYDGTYELHPSIVATLRGAGYVLDESFD